MKLVCSLKLSFWICLIYRWSKIWISLSVHYALGQICFSFNLKQMFVGGQTFLSVRLVSCMLSLLARINFKTNHNFMTIGSHFYTFKWNIHLCNDLPLYLFFSKDVISHCVDRSTWIGVRHIFTLGPLVARYFHGVIIFEYLRVKTMLR